jgi:hypothetical protein
MGRNAAMPRTIDVVARPSDAGTDSAARSAALLCMR